jgi:Tol biopolymer transport system component
MKYLAQMTLFLLSVSLGAAHLQSCQKSPGGGAAALTALAVDRIVFSYKSSGTSEIYSSGLDGSQVSQITSNSSYESWWPKISPDRSKLMFYRAPAGTNEDYAQADLMLYDFTTSAEPRALRLKLTDGWTIQAHAEWSPDGTELVTCGTQGGVVHIFVLNSSTGALKRQLTNTGGWNCDPAWSPDGTQIVFNRCVGANCHSTFGNLDIFKMSSVNGASLVQLTTADSKDDYDPYFSPDGTQIAWLYQLNNTGWSGVGVWSIKKMTSAGAAQIFVINDTNINSKPSWTGDGARILFHRMAPLEALKYRLFSIQSDGTSLSEISPFGNYSSAVVGNISYPQN